MHTRRLSARYQWVVFGTVAVGVFISVVDYGVINIALPTIATHFDSDLPTVQWVVTAYLLTIVALMLPLGWAGDMLGRKRVYVTGIVVFVAGAALSAAAQEITWLLAARGLQAVGAAAMQGNGMAISVAVFPQEERGKVLGFTATTVALGAISGPSLGGVFVDAFGWRSVFLLPAGLGVVAAVLSASVLRGERLSGASAGQARAAQADWAGMATSAVGLVATLLVLGRGQAEGWSSPSTLVTACAAGIGMAAFVVVELRSANPMIELRLFQRRVFALGSIAGFLAFTAIVGNTIIMPFYLQGILGLAPRITGFVLIPNMAVMAVAGPLFGRLSDRIGARIPGTVGMLLASGAFVSLTRLNEDSAVWEVIVSMMGVGLGMGMFQPANNSSVLGAVEPHRYGVVSAFLNLVRNMGQTAGVAVAALIVTIAITNQGIEPNLGVLRDPTRQPDPLLVEGFLDGMRMAYLVSAGTLAIAGLCSLARGPRPARAAQPLAAPAASPARQS